MIGVMILVVDKLIVEECTENGILMKEGLLVQNNVLLVISLPTNN
jgi:hypothetical protein